LRKIIFKGKKYYLSSHKVGDILDRGYLKRGTFYEIDLLSKIRKLNTCGIYIDLGSNIGNHAIFFATQCPCTKLICVDASPVMCEILKNNFAVNKIHCDLEIINCAITDTVTNVSMSDLYEATCHIISNKDGNTRSETINSLFGNLKNVALLKMDIEEWEETAIRSANIFFGNNHPVVVAELLNDTHYEAFKKEISKYGYKNDGVTYASTPTYIWK